MKILHLSDTHGAHSQLRDLPAADVIVHSGDVGMAGTEEEIIDFFEWFLRLPYRHKIFVPGNHDCCLLDAKMSGLDDNCHLLYNSGVEIDGVKFYGVPCFVELAATGEDDEYYAAIPSDTDILVTHQPPYGILDYADGTHYGSHSLLKRVGEVNPRLHLFGHIHDAYGETAISKTRFINGAMMDEHYNLIYPQRIIEL